MTEGKRVLGSSILCAFLLSCGHHEKSQTTIRVSGAFALYPMMVQWAQEYQKANPGVRIDVSAGGAGKGITDSLAGLVDIGMVSREITHEEVAKGAVFVPVARDATFAIMNAANPLAADMMKHGLFKEPAKSVWIGNNSVTWGKLAESINASAVRPYTRSDSCGAAEVWANYLGGKQPDLAGIGVYGDPGIAEAVRKDTQGIGYSNLGYAYDIKSGLPVAGLAVIPLDGNGNGKIDPEEDLSTRDKAVQAIRSGAYPAPPAKDLYLVTKSEFKGQVALFVNWILNDGQKLVDPAGYIQISEPKLKDARSKISK
jgi:phosphate transport system substrate-binding protein